MFGSMVLVKYDCYKYIYRLSPCILGWCAHFVRRKRKCSGARATQMRAVVRAARRAHDYAPYECAHTHIQKERNTREFGVCVCAGVHARTQPELLLFGVETIMRTYLPQPLSVCTLRINDHTHGITILCTRETRSRDYANNVSLVSS